MAICKCDKVCPRQESKSDSYVHKIKDSDGAKGKD